MLFNNKSYTSLSRTAVFLAIFISFAFILYFVQIVLAAESIIPAVSFTSSTDADSAYIPRNWSLINASISEYNLSSVKFNWNGTNYTFFNENSILVLGLNNISGISENGSTFKDISRYGNNGTCSGNDCPSITSSGKSGGAYTFNTSQYINISHSASINFTSSSFTLSAWIKANNQSSVLGGVRSYSKINDTSLGGLLDANDGLGYSVANIGDLDGDGIQDIAAGAYGDADGGSYAGAVWIMFMNANGSVKSYTKINDTSLGGGLDANDYFGASVAGIGDLDADGVIDLAAGSTRDGEGAVWIMFMNANGSLKNYSRINDASLGGLLDASDYFGASVANIGDLNADGVIDLAAGAYGDDDGGDGAGALWIMFMYANGSVSSYTKINDTSLGGELYGAMMNGDSFGSSVASLGDLDGDGITDLASGAYTDEVGIDHDAGVVWIMFMNANGSVKSYTNINDTSLGGGLDQSGYFGRSVANIGDLNGDGVIDLAAGANEDADGGTQTGVVWITFLNSDGSVKSYTKINDTNIGGLLDTGDRFGYSVASIDDLNGDGIIDLAVGAIGDDDGASSAGAVWVLSLEDGFGSVINKQDAYELRANQSHVMGVINGTKTTSSINSNEWNHVAVTYNLSDELIYVNGILSSSINLSNSIPSNNYDLYIGKYFNGTIDEVMIWNRSLSSDEIRYMYGSKLEKHNSTQWYYLNNVTGLTRETYTYFVYVNDTAGNENQTETRMSFIDVSLPAILLTSSTDADSSYVQRNWTAVNSSISEKNLNSIKFNWNGTNYTFYNENSILVLGLNNISGISENGSTFKDISRYGNNGTCSGNDCPTFISSGKSGGAYTFNTSQFINISHSASINFTTSSFTLSAWIKAISQSSTLGGVRSYAKINDTSMNGSLNNFYHFGWSVANISDLDGDGVTDLAVGGNPSNSLPFQIGKAWILFMYANGSVKSYVNITNASVGGELGLDDNFGVSVANIGDLDSDGITDLVAGAKGDDDGATNAGAVWVLYMYANGTVKNYTKINDTSVGGGLDATDLFGASVANIGDLDADGITDLAVGANQDDDGHSDTGAVWVLYMYANGTVKNYTKINDTSLDGKLDAGDYFGHSVANMGDLDGDRIVDLAVGADYDDDGGTDTGAVWITFMNSNGSVKSYTKINDTSLNGLLDAEDYFGSSVAGIGDLDVDGIVDLAVGADYDDDGDISAGAVWILFMNSNGSVKSYAKINDTSLDGSLNHELFGHSVANIGDMNNDGVIDLAVGANANTDGGYAVVGAVWILSLEDGLGSVIKKQDSYEMKANQTHVVGLINRTKVTGAINSGEWNHVAVTYNLSDELVYVNGILSSSTNLSNSIPPHNSTLFIGKYFNGTIDEVMIWNRSLSSDEIRYMYGSKLEKHNSTQWYYLNNVTGLTKLNYTFFVYANDFATNSNDTSSRRFTIDLTPPSSVYFSCSPEPVTADSVLTCTCEATDFITNATTSFTEHPSTSETGTFYIICTATDNVGNSVNSTITYTVIPVSGTISSSEGGATTPSGKEEKTPPGKQEFPAEHEEEEEIPGEESNKGLLAQETSRKLVIIGISSLISIGVIILVIVILKSRGIFRLIQKISVFINRKIF